MEITGDMGLDHIAWFTSMKSQYRTVIKIQLWYKSEIIWSGMELNFVIFFYKGLVWHKIQAQIVENDFSQILRANGWV